MTSERKINGRNLPGNWHDERSDYPPRTLCEASAAQRNLRARATNENLTAGGYHGR